MSPPVPATPTATPPASAARLFPEADLARLLQTDRGEVIGRLLEEGDTDDLRWLTAACGREELRDWVERFGGRRLSQRSRCFWEAVLEVSAGAPHPLAGELWPL